MIRSPRSLALAVSILLAIITLVAAQGAPIGEVDTSAGEAVFTANCAACHQATGAGIPAAFPPLAGHVPELLAVEGGRTYVMDVVSFGLTGGITVAGQSFNGMMPSWPQLTDQQVADVLNYVATAWGNAEALPADFAAFTADEVTAVRADTLDMNAVYEKRGALGLE